MLLNIDCGYSLIRDSELMLKRRASLLRFLCILGQAGVLGELGELLKDQSDRHKDFRASNPTDSPVISTEMTFQLRTTEIGLILREWALFGNYLIWQILALVSCPAPPLN